MTEVALLYREAIELRLLLTDLLYSRRIAKGV